MEIIRLQVAEADVKLVLVQNLPPDLAHDGGRVLLRAPPGRKQIVNEVLYCEADRCLRDEGLDIARLVGVRGAVDAEELTVRIGVCEDRRRLHVEVLAECLSQRSLRSHRSET